MHFLVTVAVLVSAPPSGGAEARRSEAEHTLAAALRAGGADVVEDPVAAVRQGWTAKQHLAFFARAAALVGEGRAALARVELARAETLMAEAEAIYAPELGRAGVRDEWAEAAKWHGVALFELKRREEALAAWRRARSMARETELTEAMVRPEVARAFAGVRAGAPPSAPDGEPSAAAADDVELLIERLGLDEIVVAAIALDGGAIRYAATRRARGCGSATVEGTRADELVRRLKEAPCRAGAPLVVAAPTVTARPSPERAERRARLWRRPWFWVTLVGAVGVGVVVAVNLWPRDPSYSATLDFHQFALGRR